MTTTGPHHPQCRAHYKPNLHVMGVTHALLKNLEDELQEDTFAPGAPLLPTDDADAILDAQQRFTNALLRLHNKQLLKPSTTMTLLRNFHNNVPVHRLRAATTSDTIASRWDKLLHNTVATILDTPDTTTLHQLTHLPTHLGGLGIHDISIRRHVAFYSAWRQTAYHAHAELSSTTEHDWQLNNPTTRNELLQAIAKIQPLTDTTLDVDWTHWIGTKPQHTQKKILLEAYEKTQSALLDTLTPTQQAITRSAGGKGAAAWLYPPPNATTYMPRKHYVTALRYRTHTPITSTTQNTQCQHKNKNRTCLHPLDIHGHHALTCPIGGQPNTKHNHIRDILHKWLTDMGYLSHREQHIPELDDTDTNGNHREAIMDVVTTINDRQYLIDVSVTDAVSNCPTRTSSRSHNNATAAKERETQKRTRYHNDPRLIPFVLETGGRWGPTAEEWIKTIAPTDLQERSIALSQLRYNISTSLQRSNADMILTAHN